VAVCVRRSSFMLFTHPVETEDCFLDSVVEMQTFLVTLIRKFDIAHADHQPQIMRNRSGLMVPVVLGEEYKGMQLPLKISAIRGA